MRWGKGLCMILILCGFVFVFVVFKTNMSFFVTNFHTHVFNYFVSMSVLGVLPFFSPILHDRFLQHSTPRSGACLFGFVFDWWVLGTRGRRVAEMCSSRSRSKAPLTISTSFLVRGSVNVNLPFENWMFCFGAHVWNFRSFLSIFFFHFIIIFRFEFIYKILNFFYENPMAPHCIYYLHLLC